MSLSAHERRTVLIGVVLAAVFGGYSWVIRPLLRGAGRSSTADTRQQALFADAALKIKIFKRVSADLEKLTKELNVEVSAKSGSDQKEDLVKKFEGLSGRAQVKLNKITYLTQRTRAAASHAVAPTGIRLDMTGENDAAIVRFLDNLEMESVPIVFDQLTITTTGGRGGGSGSGPGSGPPREGSAPPGESAQRGGESARRGGGPPQRGGSQKRQMQAALTIHTYLFPEKAQP